MFLDQKEASSLKIQFGNLGLRGYLGYENLHAVVQGKYYDRSISAHPPSRLEYTFEKPINYFDCWVGLADSSTEDVTANFIVKADGIIVAVAEHVSKANSPIKLHANLYEAKRLELIVEAEREVFCHATWLNPQISYEPDNTLRNPLGGVSVDIPSAPMIAEKCITFVSSPGYEDMIDNMLGSLYENGNCRDASILILAIDKNEKITELGVKYGAMVVGCSTGDKSRFTMKNATYLAPFLVYADQYLYLDGDMIVLNDLSPIFTNISSLDERNVYCCPEFGLPRKTFGEFMTQEIHPYHCHENDANFLSMNSHERNSLQLINGGLVAGSRRAMLGLYTSMLAMMPNSAIWEALKPEVKWREQAILNLAAIRNGHLQLLRPSLNVQVLHAKDIKINTDGKLLAVYNDTPVDILHFNGAPGKDKYAQVQGYYVNLENPKFGTIGAPGFDTLKRYVHSYAATTTDGRNKVIVDTFYKNIKVLEALYQNTEESSKTLMIGGDILMLADLSCTAYSANGRLDYVFVGSANEKIDQHPLLKMFEDTSMQSVNFIKDDPLVHIKKLKDTTDQFDTIYLDTNSNDKHVTTSIMIALSLLKSEGSLYILDVGNSMCELPFILDKINKRQPHVSNIVAKSEHKSPHVLYQIKVLKSE